MVWKKAHVRGSDVLGGGRRLPEQHPRPPPAHPPARVWEPLGGLHGPGGPQKAGESPDENTSRMRRRAAQALRSGAGQLPSRPHMNPHPPPRRPAWLLPGHIGSQAALSVGLTTGAGAGLRTQSPLGSKTRGTYRDPFGGGLRTEIWPKGLL